MLVYPQEELEIRIGERISRGLTEAQLLEFDKITDQVEAARWLEINRPDYREIVTRTIAEMKDEIRENRAKLLAQVTTPASRIGLQIAIFCFCLS